MKFFKNILQSIKSPFEKLGTSPEYDWYFALSCFTLGFIIVLVVNVFVFIKLASPEDDGVETERTRTIKINKENIRKAVESVKQSDMNASVIPPIILDDPSM